jgi:hypothetical protein
MKTKYAVAVLLVTTACASKPRVQPPAPWFTTDSRLDVKAAAYQTSTMAMTNNQGLLLYSAFKPFTNPTNYRESHNLADAPAWHGALMASVALKLAVDPNPGDEANLTKLADGLLFYYTVTGKPGLVGRSYLADYTGPRLPWMEDSTSRPTKYWMQGTGGRWWRNGLAKGHLTYAVLGCGIPLILHDQGRITLSPSTVAKLKSFMLPAVQRLVDGGFRYTDHDGGFTEFGDLRPDVSFGPDWPQLKGVPNGFNRAIVLSLLACCRSSDAGLNTLYEEKSKVWASGIKLSLELAGELVRNVGHSKLGKPSFSDMQLFGMACFTIMLQEQRRDILRGIHGGMVGLWEYMRYERNPLFTLPYALVRQNEAAARVPALIEDLRAFPMPADKTGRQFTKKDTDKIQPLANRTTNSHYWKSSPFRKVTTVGPKYTHPTTGAFNLYSGQDYLLAYWLGRFVGLIPDK